MTTQTLTLTDFLLARIAEDEELAERLSRYGILELSSYRDERTGELRKRGPVTVGEVSSDRLLAECEAKRRIVNYARTLQGGLDAWHATCGPANDSDRRPTTWVVEAQILGSLALPYADHPDYREEWRV